MISAEFSSSSSDELGPSAGGSGFAASWNTTSHTDRGRDFFERPILRIVGEQQGVYREMSGSRKDKEGAPLARVPKFQFFRRRRKTRVRPERGTSYIWIYVRLWLVGVVSKKLILMRIENRESKTGLDP